MPLPEALVVFSFRVFSNRTGTVLVKATLAFQSNQINAAVIKVLFLNAISGGFEVNGLKFDPKFTQGKHA